MELISLLKFVGFESISEKKYLSVFYTFFIFFLLWYYSIFLFVLSVEKEKFYPQAFFSLIIPFQYIVSYNYFRSQETKKIYDDSNEIETSELKKYFPDEEKLIDIIFIISFLLTIGSWSLFFFYRNDYFEDANIVLQIVSYFFIPLSLFYGFPVISLNIVIFSFSFIREIHKMSQIRKKITNKKWNNRKISVASLCYEIFDIRFTLSNTINKLEDIYTSTTLLGAFALGFFLQKQEITAQGIIGIVLYFSVQTFFLIIINCIGNEREKFKQIVRTRDFASRYILRRDEFCQACLDIQKECHDEKDIFADVPKDFSGNLSLFILQRERRKSKKFKTLKGKNKTSFLMNPQNEETFEKKEMETLEETEDSTIGSLEDSENIRIRFNNLLNEEGDEENPHNLADTGCVLTSEEYIRCIYEWVSNTGSITDWIVLNSILNEDWACFSLIGINFGDAHAFRKALSVTSVLIATGSVFGLLERFIMEQN
jgi:hypothetical protein